MSSRCETICLTQILTIPSRTKSLLISSSSHWKTCSMRFSSLRFSTRLTWSTTSSLLLIFILFAYWSSSPRLQARLTWSRTLLSILRAQLALQGLYCAFCALGGSNITHTRLSLGHDSDTICKYLRHHPKRLVAQIFVYPRPSPYLAWDYLFDPNPKIGYLSEVSFKILVFLTLLGLGPRTWTLFLGLCCQNFTLRILHLQACEVVTGTAARIAVFRGLIPRVTVEGFVREHFCDWGFWAWVGDCCCWWVL